MECSPWRSAAWGPRFRSTPSDCDRHATAARLAAEDGDDGTNDLLVSDVIRTNELQVWFLSEHLIATPLVFATN